MNNPRRKQIKEIQDKLNSIYNDLEQIKDDEESYRENMVESIFNGEKGMVACQNVDDMDYCLDGIKDIIDTLKKVIDRKHMD